MKTKEEQEIRKIIKKEDNLVNLLQKEKIIKEKLKILKSKIKPLQKELKPFRIGRYPLISKKIFNSKMELK